jgi:hypothetical protein
VTLAGYVNVDGDRVYVHAVIRRASGTATVRFPGSVLDRVEHRLRDGRSVEIYFNAPLLDRAGNGIVRGYPFRLTR